jgi:alkyl hydroperoxide reductase subunit F
MANLTRNPTYEPTKNPGTDGKDVWGIGPMLRPAAPGAPSALLLGEAAGLAVAPALEPAFAHIADPAPIPDHARIPGATDNPISTRKPAAPLANRVRLFDHTKVPEILGDRQLPEGLRTPGEREIPREREALNEALKESDTPRDLITPENLAILTKPNDPEKFKNPEHPSNPENSRTSTRCENSETPQSPQNPLNPQNPQNPDPPEPSSHSENTKHPENPEDSLKDLIILGGGPAGLTASVYAARKKLDFMVLTKDIGGQAIWSVAVENYLGFSMIPGLELVERFQEHVEQFGIAIEFDPAVVIAREDNHFIVTTESGRTYRSRAVIVATGKSPRYLGVPGEKELIGKGVAFCATCDAPLFAGMDVAVVGGGNAALDAAMQLSSIATHVTVVSIGGLTGDPITIEKLQQKDNVEFLLDHETLEVLGDTFVSGLRVRDRNSGTEKTLDVKGVFVEIGSVPNTEFVEGFLALNERKEIIINCFCETSVPGVFAAGDVTHVPDKQIIIAAGEGAKALLRAYEFLLRQPT